MDNDISTFNNTITCNRCGSYCDIESTTINYCNLSFQCTTCPYACRCTEGYCTSCTVTAYYLWPVSLVCKLCPSNCSACSNNRGCTNCVTKYYLSGSDCLACNPKCISCYQTSCFACITGYSLKSTQCCDSSCASCNDTDCLTCPYSNQYVSGTRCLTCNVGCSQCTSTECLACINIHQHPQGAYCISCPASGYYLNQQNICKQCQPGCQTCNQNGCLTCLIHTHQLINHQCILCDPNCINCIQSNILQQGYCLQCAQTYYFNKYGACEQCPPNCLTCLDSTTCIICSNPLTTIQSNCLCTQTQFQQLDLTCVDCQYPCTQCKSKTYCTQCATLTGLQLQNFQCICSPNSYQLTDGSCLLCQPQCETCNSQGCLSCLQEQYRKLDNNKCICQTGYIDIQQDICLDCTTQQGQRTKECQYSNCGDGYWTYGEECDDGNNIIRDGCSSCQIDKSYYCINTILQPSLCYQCSDNCLACNQSGCLTCANQYKLVNSQCQVICTDNCKLCRSPTQCDKCIELYEMNHLKQCIMYQENSNIDDNMPLNSTYSLGGAGFNNSIEGSATLLDQNSKFNNLSIQLNSGFTYQFQSLNIDNFDNQNYTFQYNLTNNTFNVDFTFLTSIDKQNLIEITLIKQTQNRRLLQTTNSSGYLVLKVIPNPQPVYSADQLQQIQQVQSVQTGLTSTLTFIGPATILFGGFNMFMNILQVISWVSNLYYINVHYPGNIETFFQYMSLSSIFSIPSIVAFNQPSDDYFKQSPSRFMDQNQDPLFINNMQQILVVTMILLTLKPFLILYFICTSSKGNKRSLKVNFNQFKMDLAINHAFSRVSNDSDSAIKNYIHGKLTNFNKYYSSYLIQNINVNLLDICLAISLQLIYQLNIQYPIVAVNVALSLLSGIILMISLYQIYISSTKHIMLLEQESYIISYDSIYEGVNLQKQLAKKYGIVNIIRKILFIVCLVGFYDIPILQSIVCSLLYSISTLMLIYENPFQDKISYLKYGVPDIFMALAISLTIVFAIDDQLTWLSLNSRFQVGWVILGAIFASIIIQIGFIFQEFLINIQQSLKWVFSRLKTPRS